MASVRMKRHARLQTQPQRLLWVGDEADWSVMRSQPRPALVCPEPGCGDLLHAVRNARGTRFLRQARHTGGGAGCDHWWVSGSEGGPESARHLWLKARLAGICLHLGWAAVPEDPVTYADVWVPDAGLALEVQLRRTDTIGRTQARLAAGATSVIWFIGADVAVRNALFDAPAVRFDIVAAGDPKRTVAPWQEPQQQARLVVFATVWRWDGWRMVTGRMSGYRFIADVLSGEMGWCPPGTPGLPAGRAGWVRWTDLAVAGGTPDRPLQEVSLAVRRAAEQFVDAQWQQRRRRAGGAMATRPQPRRTPDSGLLQSRPDPETPGESEQSRRDVEDQRWLEDRPPHHEDR